MITSLSHNFVRNYHRNRPSNRLGTRRISNYLKAAKVAEDHINSLETYIKPSSLKRKKATVFYNKKSEKLNAPSRTLAEFCLNNLSEKSKEITKELFSNFGFMIEKYNLDENDLAYLLKATPDARCKFIEKYTEDEQQRLDDIKNFKELLLNAKNGDFPSDFDSRIEEHVTNLESFATAIGYSALFRDTTQDPQLGPVWVKKEGLPSSNLVSFLSEMKAGDYIVPALGVKAFPSRGEDDIGKMITSVDQRVDIISGPKYLKNLKDISNVALLLKEGTQTPLPGSGISRKGLDQRYFKIKSYVGKGLKMGVAMRAHVSGSAPLTLASLQFLDSKGVNKGPINEEKLAILAGIMTATYECGDYHSPAETAAGVCHFQQESRKENIYVSDDKSPKILEELSPRFFLKLSVDFLDRIVSDEKRSEFQIFSDLVLANAKYTGSRTFNKDRSITEIVARS